MKSLYLCLLVSMLTWGCSSSAEPGPYSARDSSERVADIEDTSATALCTQGWSWLTMETGVAYSQVYCVNHLANRALAGPDQCAAEMAECVDSFPLDDVAEDSCSRSSGNLAACDATVGELGACFSGLASGYVENAASFGCPWILGDDRTTRPLPIPDACASLPVGCRSLLGFGP